MMVPDGTRLAPEAPHPLPGDAVTAEHPLVRWGCSDFQKLGSITTTPSLLHSLRDTGTGDVLGFEESRDTLAMLLRPGTTALHSQNAVEEAGKQRSASERSLYKDATNKPSKAGVAWAHRWSPGDFVCWDNRWMIHSTTSPLLWKGDRLMHRVRLPAPALASCHQDS